MREPTRCTPKPPRERSTYGIYCQIQPHIPGGLCHYELGRPLALPDDERQVLEPILTDPGLTQIEVTDRTGLSKAKVSQTLTELRERGLIYRESAGRTYRLFPGKRLDDTGNYTAD